MTLYPGKSLVHNFGNDLSGTNCGDTDVFNVKLKNKPIKFKEILFKSQNMQKNLKFLFQ